MSTKRKQQIKFQQRARRHKRRVKLQKKGFDPNEFFQGGFFLGPKKEQS